MAVETLYRGFLVQPAIISEVEARQGDERAKTMADALVRKIAELGFVKTSEVLQSINGLIECDSSRIIASLVQDVKARSKVRRSA